MKQIYLVLILPVLIFIGCSNQSKLDEFKERAIDFASKDSCIDQQEYKALVERINRSDDKEFQQFKKGANGLIDDAKVVSYLQEHFKTEKLTPPNIWQHKKADEFNINVFLENSGSMDGYVKGVTEFETAIYSLLGDFKTSGLCDSLNLSYINKSILNTVENAKTSDIQEFIEKLEPSTFKQKGGDRSVSDLKNILSTVLKKVDKNSAAVLISDFVFSPGSRNNADDFLNNQNIGIKIDFAEKLKTFDLSVVVIQLQSRFDGFYYDKTDKPILINCKRPYYIWIMGNTQQIGAIVSKKMLDNIKGGYQNRFVLQSIKEENQPCFKIQHSSKIGEFARDFLAQGIITGASVSSEEQNKGTFGFTVAVDFSNSVQDASYFLDAANYNWSNKKYRLKIEAITDKDSSSLLGATHLLKLQTEELGDEVIKIDVVGHTPSWVDSSTSKDDANILNNEDTKRQTFGLNYLIEGIYDAFYPKSKPNTNTISSISITIEKNSNRKGFFTNLYEWGGFNPLYSRDMGDYLKGWDATCTDYTSTLYYGIIGWIMLGLTVFVYALQYHFIDSSSYNKKGHCRRFAGATAALNSLIAFLIPFKAGDCCKELNLTVLDCIGFGVTNAVFALLLFILISSIPLFRRFSTNCRYTTFWQP